MSMKYRRNKQPYLNNQQFFLGGYIWNSFPGDNSLPRLTAKLLNDNNNNNM